MPVTRKPLDPKEKSPRTASPVGYSGPAIAFARSMAASFPGVIIFVADKVREAKVGRCQQIMLVLRYFPWVFHQILNGNSSINVGAFQVQQCRSDSAVASIPVMSSVNNRCSFYD